MSGRWNTPFVIVAVSLIATACATLVLAEPGVDTASRSIDSIIKELGPVPRPEHPRPDRYRSRWHNLNGVWEFVFDSEDKGLGQNWQKKQKPTRIQFVRWRKRTKTLSCWLPT